MNCFNFTNKLLLRRTNGSLSFAVICNQFVADARSLTISTDFF